jgi:hypothetical protein
MNHTFTIESDGGHGWLIVPLPMLAAVGLTTTDFSNYSYVDADCVYLEEDRDLAIFGRAFETKYSSRPTIVGRYVPGQSQIRRKVRIHS